MNNKDRKAFVIKHTKTTVAISSFLFLLNALISDLNMDGVWSTSGYYVARMAIGALGIGLGFGLASVIYTNPKLSQPAQIAAYMATGCTVMVVIAYLLGFIPTDKGLLPALLAILFMLLTAFIVFALDYRRQKKLADRINQELEQRQQ